VDWAKDVFPTLLDNDVPFHIHEVHEYWNDVGSLGELRQGTFDALAGKLRLEMEGEQVRSGVTVVGASPLREDTEIEGDAWIGRDVTIGAGVRLMGPIVLGDGVQVGDGAQLRESIVFPGTRIEVESILIGAIAGHGGILQSLRRGRQRQEARQGEPLAGK
jgi:mannose-1-phosphate guanylyltransferase/mannose-1-phosphate guanylyltransferase/phosphomannomutase